MKLLVFAVIYDLALLWGLCYLGHVMPVVVHGDFVPHWWAVPFFITQILAGIVGLIWTLAGICVLEEC
jgi:hypothetical protein